VPSTAKLLVDFCINILDDPDWNVRQGALKALDALLPHGEPYTSTVCFRYPAAHFPPGHFRIVISTALDIQKIISKIQDVDSDVRQSAIDLIARIGQHGRLCRLRVLYSRLTPVRRTPCWSLNVRYHRETLCPAGGAGLGYAPILTQDH
jgi:hypothetical protein